MKVSISALIRYLCNPVVYSIIITPYCISAPVMEACWFVVGSNTFAMESPTSMSMILPANKTMEVHIWAANPISRPTDTSFNTTVANPSMVLYSG